MNGQVPSGPSEVANGEVPVQIVKEEVPVQVVKGEVHAEAMKKEVLVQAVNAKGHGKVVHIDPMYSMYELRRKFTGNMTNKVSYQQKLESCCNFNRWSSVASEFLRCRNIFFVYSFKM